MHDIRALRDTPDLYEKAWAAQGRSGAAAEALALDQQVRAARTASEAAQARRNELSRRIGQAKAAKDEAEAARLLAEVEALKTEAAGDAEREKAAEETLRDLLASLPNLPAPETPEGEDESGNVEVRRWGEPFALAAPRNHADLGEALDLMDFEAAARMSGARFVVLKGRLARLERALGQFMLDMQTLEHGYTEVYAPYLVNADSMRGTGQ